MGYTVRVQNEDFDLTAEVADLRREDTGVGAVCAFVGTVRDRNDGSDVASLELEHYPGMTEKAIQLMMNASISVRPVSFTVWVCCNRRTRLCWWL